jgi:DNA repair protein RecO (recombination protein O)
MFVHYRTLGVIIKKEDRGEADQIFTILTKDFGKLKVSGRAIRKIKSKLRAGAQLFYLSEIEFIQGKAYKTLTDAVLIEKFGNLRKDLDKLEVANKITEAVDNLVKGEEADKGIWSLVLETFKRLNNSSGSFLLIYHYFLWNFLSILGYEPELNHCIFCEEKLTPEDLSFDLEQSGLLCGNCSKNKKQEISPETIKILKVLLKKDWTILSKLKIKPKHEEDLEEFSEYYLSSISALS